MTAEISSSTIAGSPDRFEFRNADHVLLEREGDNVWLLHVDGAIIRLKSQHEVYSISAALTQLPVMASRPGDEEPHGEEQVSG